MHATLPSDMGVEHVFLESTPYSVLLAGDDVRTSEFRYVRRPRRYTWDALRSPGRL